MRLVGLGNGIEEIIIKTVTENRPETAQHLITIMEKKLFVPRDEIMESILRLQREGKIEFQKSSSIQVPQNLSAYLKAKAAFWYWMTIGLTFVCALVVFTFQDVGLQGYIRYILGSVFVLGLPGYSLVRALFPSKFVKSGKTSSIDILTTFSLAIVLSIGLVSIVGLVLNYTPWGVQLSTIVLNLSSLTVILATVAAVRENQNTNSLTGELENGKYLS
jgi:hypothetical protein